MALDWVSPISPMSPCSSWIRTWSYCGYGLGELGSDASKNFCRFVQAISTARLSAAWHKVVRWSQRLGHRISHRLTHRPWRSQLAEAAPHGHAPRLLWTFYIY